MLKIYFLTAIRSLLRNKSYTILNIAGLALGITCSILLFLVIKYELSYDTFHTKGDRIYRVIMNFKAEGEIQPQASIPVPVTKVLRENNPGVELVTQVYGDIEGQITVPARNGNPPKHFRETAPIAFVEPGFFEMFSFDTGNADFTKPLSEPNNIILTKTLADKYFPEGDAVGQIVKFNNKLTLHVAGVIPDLPVTTDFPFVLFISYPTVKEFSPYDIDNWNTTVSNQNLFVMLPDGAEKNEFSEKINRSIKPHIPEDQTDYDSFYLQPLSEVHFGNGLDNYAMRTVSKEVIWGMAIIGIFLIITACINFINLATAQAVKRAKEVGMRKVLGSGYWQIILQFLGETFIITLTATLLSVILTELALPYLNKVLELEIPFSLINDPVLLLFLVLEIIVVTLFAGLYPAFILARFQPITAFRSRISTQKVAGLSLRQALVVVQFTICQVLIICTIIVSNQMEYFRNKPLGFDKEGIILLRLPVFQAEKLMVYRQELLSNPAIQNVSFALSSPSSTFTSQTSFRFNNGSENMPFQSNTKYTDEHYFDLFDIKFVAGRSYTKSDSIQEYVINETMRRKLGIKSAQDAIGMKIGLGSNPQLPIVGVVEDFHQSSLHQPIAPSIMTTLSNGYFHLAAKVDLNNTEAAIKHLEKTWYKAYPDDVFNYEFLDETFARFYSAEIRQNTLFKVFAGIAILIGCLGLYGLVAFMAAQRTKEVGIRKVMGASIFSITLLFSKEFIKLVLVAFVIAVPIAYYLMNSWLQDFTYRITLNHTPFLLAGFATLVIALLTMSTQAIKAAMANPVISLKSE
ncbi:ABC transporter permease [Pontibacter sp. KCTC 32443]|uniref:ABC transporter permease n=1 Tax=Pontibacter TaxID=323449 RepID=UPI00164E73C0|nr:MULTISPECIES: ABC transporter permease [Pontibacter]MBC5773151.1 ABC transporter permease [Pontibacter sp. KCTC 32443]